MTLFIIDRNNNWVAEYCVNRTADTLGPIMARWIGPHAALRTDSAKAYPRVLKNWSHLKEWKHKAVNHTYLFNIQYCSLS